MPETRNKIMQAKLAAIRLVLCDIDGCLNAGFSTPLDLPVLARIAVQITRLRARCITVTLCTGRPAGYALAIAQALGITSRMVVENGTALLDPKNGQTRTLVADADRAALTNFGDRLMRDPDWAGRLSLESGKHACLSLNSHEISDRPPAQICKLMAELRALPGSGQFEWAHSTTAIDITPKGISKASGVAQLLGEMELGWGAVAAIGDSQNDLSVLERAALGLCPKNAEASVRECATFTSSKPYAEGVKDLLGLLEEENTNG
ncbi:HAD family hydrolase [Aliiroseovarius crassostreae]|uniref:HAD family hydrolase n=1 Tax=Aliiroseovarius crassostreae TaxID=154981 RepID=UPI0021FA52B5|nr:HAD family hydrolase [Aliiroseovarius crassostreae]UWQ05938.1 Cof-type HAD-IIB family hydrolase [Aliiroseovarius crassostreae]